MMGALPRSHAAKFTPMWVRALFTWGGLCTRLHFQTKWFRGLEFCLEIVIKLAIVCLVCVRDGNGLCLSCCPSCFVFIVPVKAQTQWSLGQ